jgi:hypothetical protein
MAAKIAGRRPNKPVIPVLVTGTNTGTMSRLPAGIGPRHKAGDDAWGREARCSRHFPIPTLRFTNCNVYAFVTSSPAG